MDTSLTDSRIQAMTAAGFWRNESLVEVENLLYTHLKIADVAIVAVSDPRLGERACAVVIPREGQAITLGEIVGFLERHELARQKFPGSASRSCRSSP